MFSTFVLDDQVEIASTRGRVIRVNPDFLSTLTDKQRFSYLLHQVLHLALQHTRRGKRRTETLWNIAADIVVNDIIEHSTPWKPAPQTAWDVRYKDKCVEQIYQALLKEIADDQDSAADNEGSSEGSSDGGDDGSSDGEKGNGTSSVMSGAERPMTEFYQSHNDISASAQTQSPSEQTIDDHYWRDALVQARLLADTLDKRQGTMPSGLLREFEKIEKSQINWQQLLWRFVTSRQSDYSEFDSRYIHRGHYVEELRVDGLRIAVAIDTSGSVTDGELGVFMRELTAISRVFPDVHLDIYYCDAAVNGPYSLKGNEKNKQAPVGCGGTSFKPFFENVDASTLVDKPQALIYFTDGEGDFPLRAPTTPVLWLLTESGIPVDKVPFGQSITLVDLSVD